MSDFILRKWYLDCVDSRGNVFIGYQVMLKWKKLSLNGYHLLLNSLTDGVKTWGGLGLQQSPVINDGNVIWKINHLDGRWNKLDPLLRETLHKSNDGEIRWTCINPKAEASVRLPGYVLTGYGYTELIEIGLPIWKLPIKSLYWGRAHSNNHCLIWIKWDGKSENNIIWHNSKRFDNFTINGDVIKGDGFRLSITDTRVIRKGNIASTVLGSFGKYFELLPSKALAVDENKWLGLGKIESGSDHEDATVIFEKVTW